MTVPFPRTGRLLGVDYGTVRVGLAVTDPDRLIASPLSTYTRRTKVDDVGALSRLVADAGAVGIVVGLPIHSDGRESDKSREARDFGAWLEEIAGLPVVFWDERFSTARAEEAMIFARLNPRERKARRDRVAAQMILQSYLDAGCPLEGTQAAPETEAPRPEDEEG